MRSELNTPLSLCINWRKSVRFLLSKLARKMMDGVLSLWFSQFGWVLSGGHRFFRHIVGYAYRYCQIDKAKGHK